MREDNGGAGAHEGRPYADAGGQMGSGMGARSLGCARNDVSGRVEGRAVREPPLRLVINVGFDGAKLVYFRSHEVLVGGLRMREDNGGAGAHEGRSYADAGGQMGSGMGARSLGSDVLRSE